MPRARDFKPCDALTTQDFERHPIWAFDLERGESDPDANETWVSPIIFTKRPKTFYGLFIRADFHPADGRSIRGVIGAEFIEGRPSVDFLIFLKPKYFAFSTASASKQDRKRLATLSRGARKLFPLGYEARVSYGKSEVVISGRVP